MFTAESLNYVMYCPVQYNLFSILDKLCKKGFILDRKPDLARIRPPCLHREGKLDLPWIRTLAKPEQKLEQAWI
jgi:hypothetical protein